MLKIKHLEGTLFVSVIWLNLSGHFIIVNFFGTGFLLKRLKEALCAVKSAAPAPDATPQSN